MVKETTLPKESLLHNYFSKTDYEDSFMTSINSKRHLPIDNVIKAFLTSAPTWVITLMKVRDKIAKVLKLKTHSGADPAITLAQSSFEVGEKFGLFELTDKTQHEAILGTDDSHLNFRVSLLVNQELGQPNELYISTIVRINNKMGWVYFNTIDQFHKLVVKSFLKKMRENLEKNF